MSDVHRQIQAFFEFVFEFRESGSVKRMFDEFATERFANP